MWFNPKNNRVYISHSEIRSAFPNTSFPSVLTEDDIASVGVAPVQPSIPPEVNPLTEKAVQGLPERVNGVWNQTWTVVALSDDEVASAHESVLEEYAQHLTQYLDEVASWKRYDSRINCAVRAGYPGPFQQEGIAFATWMDECNAIGYQVLAEVKFMTRELPSKAEFIAMMPTAPWQNPSTQSFIPVTTP